MADEKASTAAKGNSGSGNGGGNSNAPKPDNTKSSNNGARNVLGKIADGAKKIVDAAKKLAKAALGKKKDAGGEGPAKEDHDDQKPLLEKDELPHEELGHDDGGGYEKEGHGLQDDEPSWSITYGNQPSIPIDNNDEKNRRRPTIIPQPVAQDLQKLIDECERKLQELEKQYAKNPTESARIELARGREAAIRELKSNANALGYKVKVHSPHRDMDKAIIARANADDLTRESAHDPGITFSPSNKRVNVDHIDEKKNRRQCYIEPQPVPEKLQELGNELDRKLDEIDELYKNDPVKRAQATESAFDDFVKSARDAGFNVIILRANPLKQWEHNALIGKDPPEGFKPSPNEVRNILNRMQGNPEAEARIWEQALKQGITPTPKIPDGTQCVVTGIRKNQDGTSTIGIMPYGKKRGDTPQESITMPTKDAEKFSKDRDKFVYKSGSGISHENPNKRGQSQGLGR